jgi:hypothetical protein
MPRIKAEEADAGVSGSTSPNCDRHPGTISPSNATARRGGQEIVAQAGVDG